MLVPRGVERRYSCPVKTEQNLALNHRSEHRDLRKEIATIEPGAKRRRAKASPVQDTDCGDGIVGLSKKSSGHSLRNEAKSSRTDLDFSISEPGQFQTRGQPRRIDKRNGVANVEDLHQQGLQAIGSSENTARFEDSVRFGKQPVLQGW